MAMAVLTIPKIDILRTQAIFLLNRLVNYDLHDKRHHFEPERQIRALGVETIFAEAQSLGYSKSEFYDSIVNEIEAYESDIRKGKHSE